MRVRRAATILALASVLTIGAQPAANADPRPRAAPEAKHRVIEVPTTRWARTERLEIDDPRLGPQRFIPLLESKDEEIVAGFGGNKQPPASMVLLHYAKGWDACTDPVPVLLVHGAGVTANHAWADHPIEQPFEGLAARLVRANRKTFALTFSHPHGDNELQAEALAHVIARIREVTQAPKVDLVAWSKGGMSCRIYLSDAGPDGSTRYRGDVRRYVMLGTPNGGIDVGFAYPNLNYWILQHGTPAPLSWTRFLYYGVWRDEPLQSIFARGAFPGQAQMLARFDGRYGRARCKGQLDVDATYDGTKGAVSESPGIDRGIAEGGDMIARLKKKPIARDVELCVLAGCHPWVVGLVGERRGPCDGLILVASVFDTDPMTKGGAVLLRRDLRALNHLALAYDPRANDWVADVLALPSPAKR